MSIAGAEDDPSEGDEDDDGIAHSRILLQQELGEREIFLDYLTQRYTAKGAGGYYSKSDAPSLVPGHLAKHALSARGRSTTDFPLWEVGVAVSDTIIVSVPPHVYFCFLFSR